MIKEILFLNPIFKETVWGGNRIAEYGYELPGKKIGECWCVSAHENGDCIIKSGSYKQNTLSSLWKNHRELFGNLKGDVFPLLVKIIDAENDLSIQVHPDDKYANKYENGALGKCECWYILDCKKDATIVVGHNAQNHAETESMIREGRWSEFIREIPIKAGDFFQIEPGTLHAIKGGTLLLETQQNSDITYRVYDYDRLQNGKKRKLNIDKSIDVIKAPYIDTPINKELVKVGNLTREKLISCKYYTVEKLDIDGERTLKQEFAFMNASVLDGSGTIDGYAIKKGDHFILPCNYGCAEFSGKFSMIISYMAQR